MNRIALALLASVATLGFVSASHAADLIVDTPVVSPGVVESSDWTGAYIGANLGFGSATSTFDDGVDEWDLDGWLVGAQAGYNFQTGNLVIGIEGDLAWSGISGTSPSFAAVSRDINWTGDVTGKLGFAVDTLLFYGKAGVAFANTTSHFFGDDETQTHVGWTAGLGAAFKVTDDMSVFAEYDYADYGSKAYDLSGGDVGITSSVFKVGLNWHF